MDWSQYILIGFVFGGIFFVAAALALHWAHRHGQLSNLEKGAQTIFDDDEPMGEVTDEFPHKREKRAAMGK